LIQNEVGASSIDIKQTGSFNLSKEIVVEKCHKVLTPQVTINELTGK
jgi:beta-glucosidase